MYMAGPLANLLAGLATIPATFEILQRLFAFRFSEIGGLTLVLALFSTVNFIMGFAAMWPYGAKSEGSDGAEIVRLLRDVSNPATLATRLRMTEMLDSNTGVASLASKDIDWLTALVTTTPTGSDAAEARSIALY